MPHKFNAECRDKVPKQTHRVGNWAKYIEGLRRRGYLTLWISGEAFKFWSAPRCELARVSDCGTEFFDAIAPRQRVDTACET